MTADVVVIGAGMAGIGCARRLADAGMRPLVLDKGRGIGGRMATRRVACAAGALSFDHGAQHLALDDPGLAAALRARPGATAPWHDGADRPHHVGLPGMSGLPGALASGLEVRQRVEVTALDHGAAGWMVRADGGEAIAAALVVLTVPAPQVAPLLGAGHPLAVALKRVEMTPCLTLMAAFPADAPRPFVRRAPAAGPLAWIAQDSSKPARPDHAVTWVAQAGPDWSARHLEDDRPAIAGRLLPLLCAEIGAAPAAALWSGGHRWRYARVTAPLGRPFLRSADGGLYLGGDWCLGPRAEHAWASGIAIARHILQIRAAP